MVRYFVRLAEKGLSGASIGGTRWIIVTRDKGFLRAVQRLWRDSELADRPEMLFHEHCILTIAGGQPMCIEVARISSKRGGVGKMADLQRALDAVRKLSAEPRAI